MEDSREIKEIKHDIKNLEHTVNGNGEPGLAENVRNIKRDMKVLKIGVLLSIAVGMGSPNIDVIVSFLKTLI